MFNCSLSAVAAIILTLGICLVLPPAAIADQDGAVSGKQPHGTIEQMHGEALGLFAKGKLAEAVALWKRAETLADATVPGSGAHLEILSHLGMAFYRQGSTYFPLAQAYADRVVESDPNRWLAYLVQGDLCAENAQPACAIGNYELFLRMNPTHAQAHKVTQKNESLKARELRLSAREDASERTRMKQALPVVIESDLPAFIFYLTISDESFLTRVDILRDGERFIYQTIKYHAGDIECGPQAAGDVIEVADFNGDGFNDVKISCASQSEGRNRYLYYLFQRRTLMFIPFAGGGLPDHVHGQGDEEIRLYRQSGAGKHPSLDRVFRMSGGKLVVKQQGRQPIAAP